MPMRITLPAAALAALLTGPVLSPALSPALAQAPSQSPPPGGTDVTHATTVSELAALCAPRGEGVRRLEAIAYCQGYITAAGQVYAGLTPARGSRRPTVCLGSPGPTIAEAGIGFAAWAGQNPARAQEPALDGLLRYAQSAHPCPTTATRGVR